VLPDEVVEVLLPALTSVPALLTLPPSPVVIVVWCTLEMAAVWAPAAPCPALLAVTRPCVAPDVLPSPVVNDAFRAAAVVNVWLPPAVTLLWTAPAVPPRPVVKPELCADAVAEVWLPLLAA